MSAYSPAFGSNPTPRRDRGSAAIGPYWKYHQHVNFPTRGENILDHAYSPYSHAYKARPRPAFGKSDHSSVLLLPCYRQKLKREKPVIRSIQRWTEQSDEALCDCFQTTDWGIFRDAAVNIHEYTEFVLGYVYVSALMTLYSE